jgi:hypothetical protein
MTYIRPIWQYSCAICNSASNALKQNTDSTKQDIENGHKRSVVCGKYHNPQRHEDTICCTNTTHHIFTSSFNTYASPKPSYK